MSYRVETASSGRAGCRAAECLKAKIKIDKDELRLGSWVAFEDRGSWHWKHWGCVSGKQIQNMRAYLEGHENLGSGAYRWDFLDGYEGEESNSLDKHPDLQEKVRRVITQGFIDPEDFNGDPEMNKLGESGIRTKESKKKMMAEEKARTAEISELEAKLAATEAERDELKAKNGRNMDVTKGKKKAASKKRGRAKDESEDEELDFHDEEEERKPPKKKRATKAKVDAEDEDEDSKLIHAKKPRAKKVAKKEEAIKDEDDFDGPATITAPKERASKAKKAVKKEEVDELAHVSKDGDGSDLKPRAKKGRKKALKQEPAEDAAVAVHAEPSTPAVKGEPSETMNSLADTVPFATNVSEEASRNSAIAAHDTHLIPGLKNDDLIYEYNHLTSVEEIKPGFDNFIEQKKAEFAQAKLKKNRGGRAKKSAAPTSSAPRSTRSSRRTTSEV